MCLCCSSNLCPVCICTYVRMHCLYVSKTCVILSNSNLCLLWVVYFGQSTKCNLSWIQRWLTNILCVGHGSCQRYIYITLINSHTSPHACIHACHAYAYVYNYSTGTIHTYTHSYCLQSLDNYGLTINCVYIIHYVCASHHIYYIQKLDNKNSQSMRIRNYI